MKRFLSIALVFCLILSLSTGTVTAASGKQHDYSTEANSGIRHEVCTSLLGTRVDSYYTGSYTYRNLSQLDRDELLTSLRTLMTTTHTKKTSYNDCRDLAVKTDCQNGDGTTVSLIYTSYVATWADWCNNRTDGWNREHVWPQKKGGFKTTGAGADLHHVRPSDQPVNSTRGDKKYGYATGGSAVTGADYTGNAPGGTKTSSYFEPLDNVKGDVARICLYMYVRYGGDSQYTCGDITAVFQSVEVLLEWCELDPVDTWEMGRNEVVAAIQGNRNVFIDYPELAWLLFDKEIPTDMVTPSGEAANGTPTTSCSHSHTTLKNTREADCTNTGYTGDTYCSDCGKKLSSGTSTAALGHINANGDQRCDRCGTAMECSHSQTAVKNVLAATCGAEGYTGDTCCKACGAVVKAGTAIPATGEHNFGDWAITTEATTEAPGLQERVCSTCGHTESEEIPQLESIDPTEPDPTEPDPTEPDPTEPDPTEPATDPSDSSDVTPPSSDATTPGTTAPTNTDLTGNEAPKADYRWLVFIVIGAAAIVCVVVVLIQTKKKK